MMVVHCCKIKIQKDEETEARGAVRGTWEGYRKGEVECVKGKLLVSWWWWCRGDVFLILSDCILLMLTPRPGNGCYFLRNLPLTLFLLVCVGET